MKYKHILVALELSEESNVLIDRAVFLAKQFNADVSFIHIDGTHGEIYPELVDIQAQPDENPLGEPKMDQLRAFVVQANHPVKHFLIGTGDLSEKLKGTIEENGVELLICGHHHDFWSKIVSYSKHLINNSPVDILVVPIKSN
ncbi:universal stress global response regulator UspA [Photobacterium sanctipauli]|uniref:Universal stress protein n=1 Tax=Photobacterium sanctipauli TaxID=1342794 RepID=A0A2T3NUB9_9GAMM|nr:universal stress protein [Photobacterium sanctipauli]PSW19874.1 universal stress global response regulator UspA [Photobacterium sanctipauli]